MHVAERNKSSLRTTGLWGLNGISTLRLVSAQLCLPLWFDYIFSPHMTFLGLGKVFSNTHLPFSFICDFINQSHGQEDSIH